MLRKLGKYEIVSELGEGAMGVVYRAKDPQLDVFAALKTISREAARDAELMERFRVEAQTAAKLRHPNIIFVYEYGIDKAEGIPFIAMELLEGDSLEKIISAHKDLPIVNKLDIIIQTCRGLHYAHKRKVVHRDIKPGNIVVLTDGGLVKIVDFGIARIVGTSTSVTRPNVVMGTPVYMSPEQWNGSRVDGRSDIFSVGVVLYELLTYQKAFSANDERSLRFKIQHEEPVPLAKFLRDCPPQLEQIVSKALAKDCEQRYQTAEDFACALQQVSDYFSHHMIEVYLQEGRRSLEQGNLTIAKESFQKALEIDSSHDLARDYLDQVQQRIDARRQAQRIDQNVRLAKEALQAMEFDQAIVLLDEVLQLSPEHESAKEYKRVAIERRQRSHKILYHMERAERFAGDADLPAAKAELENVLALDHEHADALKMIGQVLREMAARETQRQVRQLVQEARASLEEKNFEKAAESLRRALALDPINIEAEGLMRDLRGAQETEREKQRLEGRMASIQAALDSGDLEQAVALADEALSEFQGHPQVLRLRAQAVRQAELEKTDRYVREQLQAARPLFEKGQSAEAVAVLQRALERVPDDPRLKSYLSVVTRAQEQAALQDKCRDAIQAGTELIRVKKFALAIQTLEPVLARIGESAQLSELLQIAREQQRQEQIEAALDKAKSLVRNENFEEAVCELERAKRELAANEIESLLASIQEEWARYNHQRESVVAQALELLETGDAAKAVELLDAAPKSYSRNEKFRQAFDQCREGLGRAAFIRASLGQFEKYIAEQSFDKAEALLRQALQRYQGDVALLGAQQRLQQERLHLRELQKKQCIDEARAALNRGEYKTVIDLLQSLPPELAEIPKWTSEGRALVEEARSKVRLSSIREGAIRDANEQIREREFAAAIVTLEKALAAIGEAPDLAGLLRFAREQQRQERIQLVLARARKFRDEQSYEEATRTLERAQGELGVTEIDSALATIREEHQKFDRDRRRIMEEAGQSLQAGDAVKALALLEGAPKPYLRNDAFRNLLAQCREAVARHTFVQAAVTQIQKYIDGEELDRAATVLDQALQTYPEDPILLRTQKRLGEERLHLREIECRRKVDEAKVAMGRSDYSGAIEILTRTGKEADGMPQMSAEIQGLLTEAHSGEQALSRRKVEYWTFWTRLHRRAIISAGAIIIVLALSLPVAYKAWIHWRSGYVELTATPWAEVLSIRNAKGKRMAAAGDDTPVRLQLPPGEYSIELKYRDSVEKVDVAVRPRSVSPVNHIFRQANVNEMVDDLVSKY